MYIILKKQEKQALNNWYCKFLSKCWSFLYFESCSLRWTQSPQKTWPVRKKTQIFKPQKTPYLCTLALTKFLVGIFFLFNPSVWADRPVSVLPRLRDGFSTSLIKFQFFSKFDHRMEVMVRGICYLCCVRAYGWEKKLGWETAQRTREEWSETCAVLADLYPVP